MRNKWHHTSHGLRAALLLTAGMLALPIAGSAQADTAVLPTTSTAELIKAREAWGMGAQPAKVEAPLAAGAVSPLPQDRVEVGAGPSSPPIVHPLVPVPVAQVSAIPESQISAAMKSLLAEREGWGKAPKMAAATGAPTASVASGSAYAVLPTNSTADLIKARETWGTAPSVRTAAVAPAAAAPTAAATAPTTGSGFAVLPTNSTADLIRAREAWGMGASAKAVSAPLAAGATSPLPQDKVEVAAGPATPAIVHALQPTPPAQPTAVPEATIAGSLKELLATRTGWGTAPSVRTAAAAPAAAAPNDARSAEVRGCETRLREAAAAGAILFESASADLDSKSNATLDALVAVAKSCGKGKIRIEGHTDSSGRASKNKDLSARRAEAVANYLRKAGIPRNRMQPVGYGQEKPLASNDTPEGRAKNRRIDFTVIE